MLRRPALLLAGCLLVAGCSSGGDDAADGGSGVPRNGAPGSASASAVPSSTADAAATVARQAKASAAYVSSVTAWRARSLAPVVTQVRTARFSDLPVTTRRETTAEAARQAQRCASLRRTRAALGALRAPALPLGVSASARTLGSALATQLAAYQASAGAALGQVTGYCTYYVRALEVDRTRGAAYEAVLAAQVPPGGCRSADDIACIPRSQPQLGRFATAFERFLVTAYDAQIRASDGEAGPCKLQEYARVCALYKTQRTSLVSAERAVVAALRAGRTGSALEAVIARSRAVNQSATQRRHALEASLFPGVDLSDGDKRFANELRVLRKHERALASAKAPTAGA